MVKLRILVFDILQKMLPSVVINVMIVCCARIVIMLRVFVPDISRDVAAIVPVGAGWAPTRSLVVIGRVSLSYVALPLRILLITVRVWVLNPVGQDIFLSSDVELDDRRSMGLGSWHLEQLSGAVFVVDDLSTTLRNMAIETSALILPQALLVGRSVRHERKG